MFNLTIPLIIKSFGLLIEYLGVIAVIISVFIALYQLINKKYNREEVRAEFARNVIFGLDFIIAADILSMTVADDLADILKLGAIVVIRVLLSYSLRKEILRLKTKK
jgi:uncharacterized membrane protein